VLADRNSHTAGFYLSTFLSRKPIQFYSTYETLKPYYFIQPIKLLKILTPQILSHTSQYEYESHRTTPLNTLHNSNNVKYWLSHPILHIYSFTMLAHNPHKHQTGNNRNDTLPYQPVSLPCTNHSKTNYLHIPSAPTQKAS